MAALTVLVTAVATAFFAKERGFGLLNQVDWPYWVKLVIALLALDLAIWFQHLVSHKVPVFWRLHQVHHADRDIDVTTAVRFHPSRSRSPCCGRSPWSYRLALPLRGVPVRGYLNACAMFNHANIALPGMARPGIAPLHRHAGHASRAPLGALSRARPELRLQPVALGPSVPDLSRATEAGHQGHDHRLAALSERGADAVRLEPVGFCPSGTRVEARKEARSI
jgi:hypothetical protein